MISKIGPVFGTTRQEAPELFHIRKTLFIHFNNVYILDISFVYTLTTIFPVSVLLFFAIRQLFCIILRTDVLQTIVTPNQQTLENRKQTCVAQWIPWTAVLDERQQINNWFSVHVILRSRATVQIWNEPHNRNNCDYFLALRSRDTPAQRLLWQQIALQFHCQILFCVILCYALFSRTKEIEVQTTHSCSCPKDINLH